MKGINIVRYTPDHKTQWNDFIAESKNATFLFHRHFMDYHSDRFNDFSLMVFNNERLVAMLPANRLDNVIYSHQGLSYGGLIVRNSMKFELYIVCFKQILHFLDLQGVEVFNLKKIPSIYASQPNDEISYLMFILKAELLKYETLSVIDLQNDFKINTNRGEGKKRGIKNGLHIREEGDFDSFWNKILIPNLNDKHNASPVHSLKEIQLLKSRFPKNIRQFNVYNNNEIVAGTTIFETQFVAHAQYISGNKDNNSLGSLDFLYCNLIEEIFKSKRYFDFGSSNENDGKQINQGLQFWKEGFGARTLCQEFYEFKISNKNLIDSILI